MPDVGGIIEGYKSTEYVLIVDAQESPGVTKISGLSEGSYDMIEQPDGGSTQIYKISSTKVKFETLVIERRMDGSQYDKMFHDWWKETFNFADKLGQGSRVRKNFRIEKRDNGVVVLTFLIKDGWIKSSKFSDLEAGSTNFFTQTIEIEHEGLERIDATGGGA
ncbi:phage tail protein [Pseudochelatococcus sp. B33]